MDEKTTGAPMDLAFPDPTSRIQPTTSNLGLVYGGIHGPSIGPLDHPPLSPQDVTQQQLMEQQIDLQNQQQQYQMQHPLVPNVHPDLILEQRTPEQAGSPLPTYLVDKRLQGLRIVTDPFDPLQTGSLAGSPVSTTSNAVAVAAALVGSPTGPILTTTSTASPIPIMDERLLGNRRAQRYKDALQLAQEASGEDVLVPPSPLLDAPGTPGREGVVSASGVPQDSTQVVESVLSPTLSLKRRLIQKLAPFSPLREQSPLSSSTKAPVGVSVYPPPLADDTDDEREKEEKK